MIKYPIIIFERGDFRYTNAGKLENGEDDLRMQVRCEYTGKFKDYYLFAGKEQMLIAMEDYDYSCLLAGKPAYVKDVVKARSRY